MVHWRIRRPSSIVQEKHTAIERFVTDRSQRDFRLFMRTACHRVPVAEAGGCDSVDAGGLLSSTMKHRPGIWEP